MPSINDDLLHGEWVHAHEEDRPGQAIYRRTSHPLPAARGRVGYNFQADGQLTRIASGAVDRTAAVAGSWSVDDNGRITLRLPNQPEKTLEVISVDADRLVVKS